MSAEVLLTEIAPNLRAPFAIDQSEPYLCYAMEEQPSVVESQNPNQADRLTPERFLKQAQASEAPPAGLPVELQALWKDVRGESGRALEMIEEEPGLNAVWVRAYLRRKRGDDSIATDLYAKAIRPRASGSSVAEREQILEVLLG